MKSAWYRCPDSNRDALQRGILNPLRLPFRHTGIRDGDRIPLVPRGVNGHNAPARQLQGIGLECIAGGDLRGVISGLKPALALLGCAIGKRMRLHGAPRVTLQRVVANLGGRTHRLCDVTALKTVEPFLRITRPDAGQSIGLQFDLH
jgi:hypothetical protein